MNLDRRSFLRGALILTASAAIPTSALKALEAISPIPMLYGNGIGDDTAALQALMDGKPLRTIDGFIGTARQGQIIGATLRITDTIHIRSNDIFISNCHINASGTQMGKPVFYLGGRGGAVTNNFFQLAPGSCMIGAPSIDGLVIA